MKIKFFIPLKFKITLVISFLLGLILLFFNYYFLQKFEEESLKSIQEKGNSISELVAYEASAVLNIREKTSFEEKIETIIANEDISYIVISKDTSIYYEKNKFIADLNNYSQVDSELISRKWKIMKNHLPIYYADQKTGDIYIGFSLAKMYTKVNELKEHFIIISLIIFVIGFILIIMIVRIFTKPLDIMVKTVHGIIEGDYTQSVNIKSYDEFDFLAESYNKMAKKIASSNKEMAVITRELEQRVKDRTGELEGALKSLQRENIQRKKAEVEISSSLHEKEVLLKEIHHRVKNNLQIVSSLFFFQSKQITDPTTLEMFRDGQNRVKSMALIHEKLYQSGDLAHIDFKEYIKKLTNFLLQSYGVNQTKVKLKINVQQVELDVDTAVPCGLIINELISNSLKHGFTERSTGEIKIDFGYDENNKLILKISDNGKGIPKDFKIENSDSLGLRLVNNLTTQLNGEVKFFNNNGTIVKLTFPNPKFKKVK